MNYSPAKTVFLFFLGLIAAGAVLLSLPVSRAPNFDFSPLAALFTSVSAVCVTGLSIVDIGTYFSFFGQIVILVLLQLGGMGYMFVSTVVTLLIGKMALKDRRIMKEMFDISSFAGLKELLIKAVVFVLAIEGIGAAVLTVLFMREYPFFKSLYLGIFHSASAFCNAGFSPFPDSLAGYAYNPAVLYVVAALIILGGLGFFVIVDIYDTYKNRRIHLSTNAKVVLFVTAVIILSGFLIFLFAEKNGIFQNHGAFYCINNAFFQIVSARTAGFSSVPVSLYNEFTDSVLIFVMSIGAAPGSTAGGIKVTTAALVFAFVRSVIMSEDDAVLFKRTIPNDLIKKSLAIFVIFFISISLFSTVMILLESNERPVKVIFEVVSAFGTTGLSAGITDKLSLCGKIVIIVAMIAGRIGIVTVLIMMLTSNEKKRRVKYPEARIFVG
jgi:trk system potassium uptake protein TrkH